MTTAPPRCAIHREQGFDIFLLGNDGVEIAVVPELGARIISLRNLKTGREWLWRPAGGLKLFRNQPGDDFARSPLAGADECFPTIAPCRWQNRDLPDHGELWSAAWTFDAEAWRAGILRTQCRLNLSPFVFERSITLAENEVRLAYCLQNLSSSPERFLWAIHPLLRIKEGDHLELPAATRALFDAQAWIDDISSAAPDGRCAKVFASALTEGRARVVNQCGGDCLEFAWDAEQNNCLGLWLNRGGWHGHHHLAVEPTNADSDDLASAAQAGRGGLVPARGSISWQLALRLGKTS
jgi:galactose mutarotase-like enzyme